MPYFYQAPEQKAPAGSRFREALRDSTAPDDEVIRNSTTGAALPKKSSPARAVVYGTSYHADGFLTVRRRREHRASMHKWS